MSNDPLQTSDFHSRQFQKIQFGHKPHEETKSDEAELAIKEKVKKPAGILKLMALVSLLILFCTMMYSCTMLAASRDEWVQYWDSQVLAEHRTEARGAVRPDQKMTKKEEEAIKAKTDWNKNYFTIMIGLRAVMFFAAMCFSAFIAVSAHKMMQLQGYRQGMAASIMSLIPFISPLGILGIPIGIWLIVVLRDRNVRRAFN